MSEFTRTPLEEGGLRYEACEGRANIVFTGTGFGSVEFCAPDYPRQVARLEGLAGNRKVVQMYSGMTNNHLLINDPDALVDRPEKRVLTTTRPFDALTVSADTRAQIATLQTNGDCPLIVIVREDGAISNIHGGLDCIEKGDDPSVIEVVVKDLLGSRFKIHNLQVFVCAGARECCYGHLSDDPGWQEKNRQRAERVCAKFGDDVVATISNPPRRGGHGYNMFKIIQRTFKSRGLPDANYASDTFCTSCDELATDDMSTVGAQGQFFSHLRQGPLARERGYGDRNAVLVW